MQRLGEILSPRLGTLALSRIRTSKRECQPTSTNSRTQQSNIFDQSQGSRVCFYQYCYSYDLALVFFLYLIFSVSMAVCRAVTNRYVCVCNYVWVNKGSTNMCVCTMNIEKCHPPQICKSLMTWEGAGNKFVPKQNEKLVFFEYF